MNGYQKLRNRNSALSKELHEFKLRVLDILEIKDEYQSLRISSLIDELGHYRMMTFHFQAKDIELWKAIPKTPNFNTVEEYLNITE